MNCPNCGERILDGASFCGSCGRQVGIPPFKSPQLQPLPKKDNKVLWIIVIVVILVIVLPVILSAVLYFMVLGFGGSSTQVPETPVTQITKSAVTGGCKFMFAPMSRDTQWDDVTILLADGVNTVAWYPPTIGLDSGSSVEWVGAPQMLGALEVFLNVTDLAGNGHINMGDFFTLTVGGGAFSSSTTYTTTILYDPTAMSMCTVYFQG